MLEHYFAIRPRFVSRAACGCASLNQHRRCRARA
jgi:hypothetical protein